MKGPTRESIDKILSEALLYIKQGGVKTTVVTAALPNGYEITVSSSAISAENYDEVIGIHMCKDKIRAKIFELEAYRLSGSPFS